MYWGAAVGYFLLTIGIKSGRVCMAIGVFERGCALLGNIVIWVFSPVTREVYDEACSETPSWSDWEFSNVFSGFELNVARVYNHGRLVAKL